VDPEREVELRISELIEKLQATLSESGDLCVCIMDSDEECLLLLTDEYSGHDRHATEYPVQVKSIEEIYGDWPETENTKQVKVLILSSSYDHRYYGKD
jgi:hypothetical protein